MRTIFTILYPNNKLNKLKTNLLLAYIKNKYPNLPFQNAHDRFRQHSTLPATLHQRTPSGHQSGVRPGVPGQDIPDDGEDVRRLVVVQNRTCDPGHREGSIYNPPVPRVQALRQPRATDCAAFGRERALRGTLVPEVFLCGVGYSET